ncbi:uncharacterized protein LOC110870614 [Helianthus annuus]|uniref:uncharacterized protein LOC110870614 n=1 Tax=Helianthus annuus TaxID=4232 RepID=UPI000B90660D|nr:uncharacterized protein LOC110870614 [Helianthus annuus]
MKRLMRAKFLPINHKQDSFLEYHNLKQGNSSVEDFIVLFEQLRMRFDVDEDDEQVIARFLGGLRSEISDVVHLQQFWSFANVCLLAKKVEKQLSAKSKAQPRFSSSQGVPPSSSTAKAEGTKPSAPTTPVIPSGQASGTQRCYKCNGIGHLKRECPNKQVVALLDDTTPTFDHDPDSDSDSPAEVIYPDKGEALVLQRLLHATVADPSDDTAWLRTTIFWTKCTSKGKICNVIIESGSCENIVSTTMVDKLKLPLHDHPESYQLTWLKKSNLLKVTHRCLVQFSIGNKYSDEVWCEVLPMDACHILLGRPWQYDRRAKHDGFRNTYSFKKDGVNITLAPCDPRQEGAASMLVTRSVFSSLARAEPPQVIFGLLITEPNRMFLPSLPMLRDIQHCIDFLPGASIPNKPAYCMNPKEYNDLHQQVAELLEKGLIRESMSPCAVPALLVPKPNGTFRMCVDSRAVNKITIKYRFPIPRFDDLLDHLHGSKIFSKIDLRSGYH